MKSKSIVAGITAASLLVSSAFAADSPLPAGNPAGTKNATLLGLTGLPLLLAAGFVGLVVAAGAGAFSKGSKASTNIAVTTTGTGG